jgi:hypothetical protein
MRILLRTALALLLLIPLAAQGRTRVARPGPRILVSDEAVVSDSLVGPTFTSYGPRVAIGTGSSLVLWNSGDNLARITNRGEAIDVPAIARPEPSGVRRSTADLVRIGDHFLAAELICTGCSVPPIGPWRWSLTLTTIGSDGTIIGSNDIGRIDRVIPGALAAATNGRTALVFAGGETYSFESSGRLRARTVITQDGSSSAAIASDGDGYFLVWTVGELIEALHIDADGHPVERSPLLVANGSDPSVAWDGRGYAVAYSSGQSIDLAYVANGTVEFGGPIYTSQFGAVKPSLAWNGSEFGLAWKEVSADYPRQCLTFGGGDVGYSVPCAPVDLMVASIAQPNGRATGITRLRTATGWHGNLMPTDAIQLVANGKDFVLTWSEEKADFQGHDVYSLLWSSNGDAGQPRLISQRPLDQLQHAVAQNGDGFLVAWTEGDTLRHDQSVRVARITSSGERVGGPQTLTNDISAGPVTASGDAGAFVAWMEGSADARILAARIDDAGVASDGAPIVVASGSYLGAFSIACGDSDCLVVWDSGQSKLRGRRLSPAGTILDANPLDLGIGAYNASVVWNGESYLVVRYGQSILTGTIIKDGHAASPFTIVSSPFSAPYATGCNTEKCLLITNAGRTASIDRDGTVVAGPLLSDGGQVTSLAWNGRYFVAAMAQSCNLDVALFDDTGALVGGTAPLATTTGCEWGGDLAMGRDGRAIAVYARLLSSQPTRLLYRVISDQ